MSEYTPTIGIEVHAELNTNSKMFCGCKNDPHASEANANICPVCLAHPGTLPVVNKEAVKKLVTVGHAVGGEIATFSEFDRKNYFYPDIPKAYQLSQYAFPFVSKGELAGVALTRIHLEEDTARSQHDHGGGSVVDFNRAGVPLMELVTEPVIHDTATAVAFGKELQLLLRSLGVSEANMEKGEMRVEANISVSKDVTLGKKVEVKNLNSFKAMEAAIKFEVKRQIAVLEKGGEIVQETRGWDENRERTFSQRTKETAEDYRYFPDPDIPKYEMAEVEEFNKSRLSEMLEKTPEIKRNFYSEISVPGSQIELIIANTDAEKLFREIVDLLASDVEKVKLAANYFTTDLFALVESSDKSYGDALPAHFAELVTLLYEKKINSRVAKDLLPEVLFASDGPAALATERNLLQVTDEVAIGKTIDAVLVEHATVADEYRAGKESVLQFLVGQGMKATRGAADPGLLARLLKERLQ